MKTPLDMGWDQYFRSTARIARGRYLGLGFKSLTTLVLEEIHRATGLAHYPAGSLCSSQLWGRVVTWKNQYRWSHLQSTAANTPMGEQSYWRHSARYGRR